MKKISLTPLMLIIFAFFSFIVSCKKAGDPNIVYSTFNKTISGVPGSILIDSLDFNLDTHTDLRVSFNTRPASDTIAIGFIGDNVGVYIDSTQNLGLAYLCKSLNKDEAPALFSTKREWTLFGFLLIKRGADVMGAFSGAGDKFIPLLFINTITSKKHYGWMRINLSSDNKTFKIIDGAYNLIPDVPLKMGAK